MRRVEADLNKRTKGIGIYISVFLLLMLPDVGCAALKQHRLQIAEGESAVEDVLHNQDMVVLRIDVNILDYLNHPGSFYAGMVAYGDKKLLVLGVLKGSFVFMADLVRQISVPCEMEFMAVSSYHAGVITQSRSRPDRPSSE